MWVFFYKPKVKSHIMEWKYISSPVKKWFRVKLSVKKVMLIVFQDMKRAIIIDFLVNGAFYCKLFCNDKLADHS